MHIGTRERVRLKVDLTRYHKHLEVGAAGWILPGVKVSDWGSQDRFGAVKFDCCGATLDIVTSGLSFDAKEEAAT